MEATYEHTQPGYVTGGATAAAAVATAYALITTNRRSWVLYSTLGLLSACSMLFASLTVRIQGGELHFYFGPGFWHKQIRLDEIEHHEVVRNPWFYGWGIRYTPHGWLYNVSGRAAVEVHLKSGGRLRVGTDEPHRLDEALAAARRAV